MSFKTKHTPEEREDWISKLKKKLMPLLVSGNDIGAIQLFNEKSKLGFIDSIVAVHALQESLREQGKLPRRILGA